MSFDFYDLERVEVVRGPQGTLYGRNTTAGAINVLTARPADHFEARLFGGYGSFERAEAEGMLNLPLGENAAFRVAGRFVDQGEGFWESRLLPGETIGEQNVWQARAQLAFALGENWDVNLKVDGLRQRSEMGYRRAFRHGRISSPARRRTSPAIRCSRASSIRRNAPTSSATPTPTAIPSPAIGCADNQYDIDQTGATARVEGDLGFATLTSITGYIDFERDFYIDSDASPFRQFEFNQLDWVEQFTQEVRLSGESERGSTGSSARFYSQRRHQRAHAGLPRRSLRHRSADHRRSGNDHRWPRFAHGEWALTDRLDLITGVRYTDEEKDYAGGTLDQNPFGVSVLRSIRSARARRCRASSPSSTPASRTSSGPGASASTGA